MRTFTGNTWRLAAAALGLSLFVACGSDDGGGSGGPMTPSGSGPGPSGATITVGTNGTVSPSTVSITVGQSVTFVNNDSRSHELASDPHPAHTNCPSINALGHARDRPDQADELVRRGRHLRIPRPQRSGQPRPEGNDHDSLRTAS